MEGTKRATEKKAHLYDTCGGRLQHQEEETSSDLGHSGPSPMALEENKGRKGGTGGEKQKGFQGYCCGKCCHRLDECWVKDRDMKANGGSWSNTGGRKEPKGQGSLHKWSTVSQRTMGKGGSTAWQAKRGVWNHADQGGVWEGRTRKRTHGQRWNVLVRWSFSTGCFAGRRIGGTRNAVLPVQWGLSTEYWRPSPLLHELLTPGFWCKHESD